MYIKRIITDKLLPSVCVGRCLPWVEILDAGVAAREMSAIVVTIVIFFFAQQVNACQVFGV